MWPFHGLAPPPCQAILQLWQNPLAGQHHADKPCLSFYELSKSSRTHVALGIGLATYRPVLCDIVSEAATMGQVLPDAQGLLNITALRMEGGHIVLGLKSSRYIKATTPSLCMALSRRETEPHASLWRQSSRPGP